MCGEHIEKKSFATHQSTDCPMKPEPCVHCDKDVPVKLMQVCQLTNTLVLHALQTLLHACLCAHTIVAMVTALHTHIHVHVGG